ncbi:MAG: glycosyltransferase [Lachnospiraceae bacterium]|nr:glycosyltransferase [Lachnospiraceae bacterium]
MENRFAGRLKKEDYDEISSKKILFVIVSYNSFHLMRENIRSIRATMPEGTYLIVVTDNASTDGVREWLAEDEGEDIWVILNDENVGFGPACNQAVCVTAGTEYENADVFLLNNDTRLCENAAYICKSALYSFDDVGAVGAVSNYAGNQQRISVEFEKAEQFEAFGKLFNLPPVDENGNILGIADVEERCILSGFAMMIRREVWDAVGGFDDDFAPGYFEDTALSCEISRLGYRLFLVNNAFIYHAGSQSFAKTDFNALLLSHQKLFVEKYGFDVLELAYANKVMVENLAKDPGEEFKVLQYGSGLGADLKYLRSMYPFATVVGIEERDEVKCIAEKTIPTFSSVSDLMEVVSEPFFDVLIIEEDEYDSMPHPNKQQLLSVCTGDVTVIFRNTEFCKLDFSNLSLVVWNADRTGCDVDSFGTLAYTVGKHADLLKDLADCGVMNFVLSKIDKSSAWKELEKEGVSEFFVSHVQGWKDEPGGVCEKLLRMGIKNESVLYLDDDPERRSEVKKAVTGIMTGNALVLPYLRAILKNCDKKDKDHIRLNQYKIMERRADERASYGGAEEFLYYSKTLVSIHKNCLEQIDRIAYLVAETNRLNYTKNRDTKDRLIRLVTNDWNDCGYVCVSDRFGNYGMVGFYCYNRYEERMEHFLFSDCVLGMGIEQYVYNKLGCPEFCYKDPVVTFLEQEKEVLWLTEDKKHEIIRDKLMGNRVRILLKGPRDLSMMEPFIGGANVTTEYDHANDAGLITAGQNHSCHIYQSATMSEQEIQKILDEAPFITRADFETGLFRASYHVICYSLLPDFSAGLYRNKETGTYISFGSRNVSLTDPINWPRWLEGTVNDQGFHFTEEILKDFSEHWEFIGGTPPELLLRNLDYMLGHVPGNPGVILMLGNEMAFESSDGMKDGFRDEYRRMNSVITEYAKNRDDVTIINPTDYIRVRSDIRDCADHYSEDIYYEMSGMIVSVINDRIARANKK